MNMNGAHEIHLLIGSPGAGKTYLGRKLARELNGIFLDDTCNIRFFKHFSKKYRVLINCHPILCIKKQREKAVEEILKVLPSASFVWYFFENNPTACRANVVRRNDGRRVNASITRFSKLYTFPANIIPLPVYQPTLDDAALEVYN